MPWVDVGRHTFDLASVEVVTRGVEGQEGEGVTICLVSGKDLDLAGEDARSFTRVFREFSASRPVRRGDYPGPGDEDELRLPDAPDAPDAGLPAAGRVGLGPSQAMG